MVKAGDVCIFKENDNPVYNNQPVWYKGTIRKILNPENKDPVVSCDITTMSYDNKRYFEFPCTFAWFRSSKIEKVIRS